MFRDPSEKEHIICSYSTRTYWLAAQSDAGAEASERNERRVRLRAAVSSSLHAWRPDNVWFFERSAMRTKLIPFLAAAAVAAGQTPASDRTFYFAHTSTLQAMQEIAT